MVLNINYCLGFKCEACHVTKMTVDIPRVIRNGFVFKSEFELRAPIL